jgi:hypothetical protein
MNNREKRKLRAAKHSDWEHNEDNTEAVERVLRELYAQRTDAYLSPRQISTRQDYAP